MIEQFIGLLKQGSADTGTYLQAGAEDVGTKTVWSKYVMPYDYGAPSGILGMQSGQYAGTGKVTQMMPRTEYTTGGKIMKTLGAIASVGGADAAGAIEGMSWATDDYEGAQISNYNEWVTNQQNALYGKSGIYIKPSKRGSFTAWCKKQGYGGVTSECKSAGKRSNSPAIRKKATFATNAAKWKKGK